MGVGFGWHPFVLPEHLPGVTHYGMVGEYKVDVSILEITEGKWQMRIYLRSPDNVR